MTYRNLTYLTILGNIGIATACGPQNIAVRGQGNSPTSLTTGQTNVLPKKSTSESVNQAASSSAEFKKSTPTAVATFTIPSLPTVLLTPVQTQTPLPTLVPTPIATPVQTPVKTPVPTAVPTPACDLNVGDFNPLNNTCSIRFNYCANGTLGGSVKLYMPGEANTWLGLCYARASACLTYCGSGSNIDAFFSGGCGGTFCGTYWPLKN